MASVKRNGPSAGGKLGPFQIGLALAAGERTQQFQKFRPGNGSN